MLALMRFARTLIYGLMVMTIAGMTSLGWLWWQGSNKDASLQVELNNQVRAYQGIRKEIEQKNQVITALEKIQNDRIQWVPVSTALLKAIPPGVVLHSLTLDQGNEFPLVELTGEADTRNTLVVFEQKLREMPWVEQVQSPRSNLLQATETQYRLVVLLNPEKLEAVGVVEQNSR